MPTLPEGGEDVALHVAFVAAVGAGGEVQLLGRQPLAGEVGAEGQRPHRVDPAGLGGGELGGETLGLGAVGAGRMPAAALLAGHRVAAFVDHRVVAVAAAASRIPSWCSSFNVGSRQSGPGGTIGRPHPTLGARRMTRRERPGRRADSASSPSWEETDRTTVGTITNACAVGTGRRDPCVRVRAPAGGDVVASSRRRR